MTRIQPLCLYINLFLLRPTQPPTKWAPGALAPEVRQSERKANHSPPSSAEIKNEWSYT